MNNMSITIKTTDGSTAPVTKSSLGLTSSQVEQVEREAKSEWSKNASVRAEFGDNFAAYLGYLKAQKAGMVKISGGRHV